MTPLPALAIAAASILPLAPPAQPPTQPPPQTQAPAVGSWHHLTFESPTGRTHDARLWSPPAALANGCAALLIGGGSVTDMHWTVPGSFTLDGATTQLTLDGHPTRDADAIAESLVRAGFAVMQWSAIHTGDPMYRECPALALAIPYPDSVELARTALRTLRDQPGVDPARVLLIGHSLGAARACHIADDDTRAMIFLAGAYLSRLADRPSQIDASIWSELAADPGDDAALNPDEFKLWQSAGSPRAAAASFDELDRDQDGVLRAWELAAADRIARLSAGDDSVHSPRPSLQGHPWPSDVLAARDIPTLALFAGHDPISVHGPLLQHQSLTHVEVEYIKDRNHQLATGRDGLTGPIDAAVIDRLTRWALDHCPDR